MKYLISGCNGKTTTLKTQNNIIDFGCGQGHALIGILGLIRRVTEGQFVKSLQISNCSEV